MLLKKMKIKYYYRNSVKIHNFVEEKLIYKFMITNKYLFHSQLLF